MMSDEQTVQLLLSLLTRVSRSKHMLKQLRRNKDFLTLMKFDKAVEGKPTRAKASFLSMQSPPISTARDDEVSRKLFIAQGGFQFNRKNRTMTNLLKQS
jgi:hypothetical protein